MKTQNVILFTGKGAPAVTRADVDHRRIVSRFTPNGGKSPKSGTIEVDGRPVKVSMRRQNARIQVQEPMCPADLAKGLWKTTIHGSDVNGRFVIDCMEVEPLVDPRTVDDPKLPRVLVVGDSISMNYHDAAKAALKGVANYHRNEGNSASTTFGVTNMDLRPSSTIREFFFGVRFNEATRSCDRRTMVLA